MPSRAGREPHEASRSHEPMDVARVISRLDDPGRFTIAQVRRTGSTNDDLALRPPELDRFQVLITEEQTAGRGRSGRTWSCPPGAGLMFSVRVPLPDVPTGQRGWVGAVLGISIVRALADRCGIQAALKWPNDVLIDGRKCAGILAEMAGDQVIVGSGINISLTAAELPRPDATSLALSGAASLDRADLLAGILAEFADLVQAWRATAGDVDASGVRPGYRKLCATLGAHVRIALPDGTGVRGIAVDVDEFGSVVVDLDGGGRQRFSAGDVTHLRMELPRS